MVIQDKQIAQVKNFSWETIKQMLGAIAAAGTIAFVVVAPWAENFILEAVAETFQTLEQKTTVYRTGQTLLTNEIKNRQTAILEYQRIKEGTDKEMRQNIKEILLLIRKNGSSR